MHCRYIYIMKDMISDLFSAASDQMNGCGSKNERCRSLGARSIPYVAPDFDMSISSLSHFSSTEEVVN